MLGIITITAIEEAICAILFLLSELAYFTNGNLKNFETKNVVKAIKIVLIVNKYMAPPKILKSQTAKPYPAVQSGGIKAVAIATPEITVIIVPRFALAMIRANPPKIAIRTSKIVGYVLASSSGVN